MKRIMQAIALSMFLASPAWAWVWTVPPEGHCESATYNADGKIVYAPYVRGGFAMRRASFGTLTSLYGTAHSGGGETSDQAGANTLGIVYTVYLWRDVDGDGAADSGDEPATASTTLTADIAADATSIPVADASTAQGAGCVIIDSELIYYTSRTNTTLTCAASGRGFNETDAAAHLTAATVAFANAWHPLATVVCDGSPYNAIGWDGTYQQDNGTERNLLQAAAHYYDFIYGRRYLFKLRVIDGSGNTNTEVDGSDVFASYGANAYVGVNGSASLGLEDDEVADIAYVQPRRIGGWH